MISLDRRSLVARYTLVTGSVREGGGRAGTGCEEKWTGRKRKDQHTLCVPLMLLMSPSTTFFFIPFSFSLSLSLSLSRYPSIYLSLPVATSPISAASPSHEGQTSDLILVHSNMAILNLVSQVCFFVSKLNLFYFLLLLYFLVL